MLPRVVPARFACAVRSHALTPTRSAVCTRSAASSIAGPVLAPHAPTLLAVVPWSVCGQRRGVRGRSERRRTRWASDAHKKKRAAVRARAQGAAEGKQDMMLELGQSPYRPVMSYVTAAGLQRYRSNPLPHSEDTSSDHGLEAPPDGCEWMWVPEFGLGVPVPDAWTASVSDGHTLKMVTRRYCISPQPPGPPPGPPMCLTATVYQKALSSPLTSRKPIDLAKALVALHVKLHGPLGVPNKNTPTPDVVDSWGGRVDAVSHVYGFEYVTRHSDHDDPAAEAGDPLRPTPGVTVAPHGTMSRWGMHYLVSVITNTKADMAWKVVFQAPEEEWDDAWAAHGADLIDNVRINWTEEAAAAAGGPTVEIPTGA